MIQDIAPHVYANEFVAAEPTDADVLLCKRGGCMLVRQGEKGVELPRVGEVPDAPELVYGFAIDDARHFVALGSVEPVGDYEYVEVRSLRNAGPRHVVFAMLMGWQLAGWYEQNRFCGTCGSRLELVPTSRELACPTCSAVIYPRINPAVIVGVTKGDELLLTKYAHREFAHYALVAGFNEVGETIEETVRREVREETGLSVTNIRYYASQPWPYSGSLLLGFFCDAADDAEPHADGDELAVARWFRREDIPDWGDTAALTSQMKRAFHDGEV